MERCLLVPLILFPFAVLGFVAFPLFPGTTALFFAALVTYALSLRFSPRTRPDSGTEDAVSPRG